MLLDEKQITGTFPAMALRGVVAFPDMMLTLDVGRKKSVRALSFAMDKNVPIYLVTQQDLAVEDPNSTHLYEMGCLCRVRQVLKMPDGGAKVLVKGLYRARHLTFNDNEYGPEYEPLMELFAKRGLEPSVICESAGTQAEDAAEMKKAYERYL